VAAEKLAALSAERDDLKALLLATLKRLEAVDEVAARADVSATVMEEKVGWRGAGAGQGVGAGGGGGGGGGGAGVADAGGADRGAAAQVPRVKGRGGWWCNKSVQQHNCSEP
jgi:hypothetical protein